MLACLVAAKALVAEAAPPANGPALAAQAAEAAALAPVPGGRLTDAVRPFAYRLDLTVDAAKERFSGHVEIDAVLAAPARFVDLHGRGLAMKRAVAKAGARSIAGHWAELDTTGVARLMFPETLPAGPVTFAFDYDAPFNDSPAGLFRVKVGDAWHAWSQFQSIDARAAFPGFDEPGFKTPFAVTLRTPPGQMAVSNAREVSNSLEGGLEVHRFEPTLPLPTYLVAIMAGPFVALEGTVPPSPQRAQPLPLRIVSTGQNAGQLAFALDGSKAIVGHLEDYFGQPFPYPKLDLITTPILPGAMENAGANLFNDEYLVMDATAGVPRQSAFGMIVSHELAHQWFGDLVTPVWWDDIWLNESFANWMGYRIGHAWKPELGIADGATSEGFAAMNTDSLVAGRPIREKIEANNRIDSAFDSITYGKGGHVVAMIAGFMGDTRFRDGVRRYMARHALGNATSTDFFAALAEAAGDPGIVPALRSFTDQQGVPLLTFARKGKGYTVRQSRYARLGVAAPAARWLVPMCLRRGAQRQCSLLAEESANIALGGKGPLVPNAGGTGYYRFDLPRQDWQKLIAAAASLPGGEAQAVADSLQASFQAGGTSIKQLLKLAKNLLRNPGPGAREAGAAIHDWLGSAELIDVRAIPAFRWQIARSYRSLLKPHGFDPKAGAYAGENAGQSEARSLAIGWLASTGRDKPLRAVLSRAAGQYLAGETAALDPAWFSLAMDAWLDDNGLAGAKLLADRALASEDAAFRPVALAAIASSGTTAIAEWLLGEFKDSRLRASERRDTLFGIAGTRATRETGYRWFKENLDTLIGGSTGIFFAARAPQMLREFCSVKRAEELARDLRPRLASTPGALELERVIERVRDCGRLRMARSAEVTAEIEDMR